MKLASILFAFSRATFGPLICCHWYRSILPSLSLLSEPSRSTCELSTASRFFLTSASGRIFLIPVITSSSVVFGMISFDSAFWFELSTVTLLLSSFGTFFSVVCVLLIIGVSGDGSLFSFGLLPSFNPIVSVVIVLLSFSE